MPRKAKADMAVEEPELPASVSQVEAPPAREPDRSVQAPVQPKRTEPTPPARQPLLVCPFSGAPLKFHEGPTYAMVSSPHGWTSRLFADRAEAERWASARGQREAVLDFQSVMQGRSIPDLSKMLCPFSGKPLHIRHAPVDGNYYVSSDYGWVSKPFSIPEQALEWASYLNGTARWVRQVITTQLREQPELNPNAGLIVPPSAEVEDRFKQMLKSRGVQ